MKKAVGTSYWRWLKLSSVVDSSNWSSPASISSIQYRVSHLNKKLPNQLLIRSYFRVALRNLIKRKGYSFLNIFGLAIGIVCCLLIFQYVAYEKSYDSFPTKAKDIVRLRLDSYKGGELSWKSATIYPAFGPTMKRDFPEVEEFCRLHDAELLLSNEDRNELRNGRLPRILLLTMFNVQMVAGNPKTALDGPDKLLVSESTAESFWKF